MWDTASIAVAAACSSYEAHQKWLVNLTPEEQLKYQQEWAQRQPQPPPDFSPREEAARLRKQQMESYHTAYEKIAKSFPLPQPAAHIYGFPATERPLEHADLSETGRRRLKYFLGLERKSDDPDDNKLLATACIWFTLAFTLFHREIIQMVRSLFTP